MKLQTPENVHEWIDSVGSGIEQARWALEERDEARYQIERAIAQLGGNDPKDFPDQIYDVVASVIAQLRAYLEA